MSTATQPLGRRERAKQEKLERIMAAAGELFAEHGVDDVTTQQIAERADIGTGTLFLYAKTKAELLLLVQNANYAKALDRGRRAAAAQATAVEAVVALLTPIVECNRSQVDNGRTYLREIVFGDPTEPHHAAALAIVEETERTVAELLVRHSSSDAETAAALARVISAVQLLTISGSTGGETTVAEIMAAIRTQIAAILPR